MSEHTGRAYEIVDGYWKWAAAAGLIPIPVLDIAAVTGVQIKMISDLAHHYELPFRKERAKVIVGSLLGAISAPALSVATLGLLGPVLKVVPGIGTVLGVVVTPAFNAAATYAIGRVFVQHFESGGTFLDMDPDKVREHFKAEFEAGKRTTTTREVPAAR